jgi:predicted phage terminase large subunit-like protein
MMMPAFQVSPAHGLIIQYLERLLSGEIARLAIITPPRIGKSTLGSIYGPAFALGKNPRETIIQISYGSDLSEGFGRRVRNTLSDPLFREIFPTFQLSPDSAAAYRFETIAGGEYSAVGRGGPVTGRGASFLVLDDLIKDQQEAGSESVCRGIIEWLQAVAFTRLTPDGRCLAIATRWSERDPMGWLMKQHGWTVLHLPALAEPNDPLGREIGEALWPGRYPVEVLEKIRTDIGSRAFQTLYQGNTSVAQGTIFKREWFQHYQQRPEQVTRIIQSWDTAFKTGATNDYSVCATFGEASNGFYLLSLYRSKCEFPELKRQVGQQADAWRPSEILVEDKASGQSLIQELKTATSYPVIAVKADRDKETRASSVTGYFEAGRVLFPEGASWLSDLEDELASFPGGLHDDQVDAISQALNRMRDSGGFFGVVEFIKDVFTGKRKMPISVEQRIAAHPGEVRVEENKGRVPNPPPCEHCGSVCMIWMTGGTTARPYVAFCNQCHAIGGVLAPSDLGCESWCPGFLPQNCAGRTKCGNCGRYHDRAPAGSGMSRAEHTARQSIFGRSFGKFY